MSEAKEAKKALEAAAKKLAATEAAANADLAGWDPRTVASMQTAKNEAQHTLRNVKDEYLKLAVNSVVKVFVAGERAADFAKSMSEEPGVIVVDGLAMYTDFAKVAEPTMDTQSRAYNSNQISMVVQVMQRWMETHMVPALATPRLNAEQIGVPAPTFADVVALTKSSIENTNGKALLMKDIEKRVTDALVEKKSASSVVPVMVINLKDDEKSFLASDVFPGRPTVAVVADAQSSDEDLIEEINKKILSVLGK